MRRTFTRQRLAPLAYDVSRAISRFASVHPGLRWLAEKQRVPVTG